MKLYFTCRLCSFDTIKSKGIVVKLIWNLLSRWDLRAMLRFAKFHSGFSW